MVDLKNELSENEALAYLEILKAVLEIPFGVGKNLLVDFLKGNYKNKSVVNNRLDELYCFGSMSLDKELIFSEIERLTQNGLLELSSSDYNSFVKVLKITQKGRNEIRNPTLFNRQLKNNINFEISKVTDKDRELFEELDFFLNGYNDEQKKAIVSPASKILCVAGAGSGKTTVLTKRIEFLVKYAGISPEKILAITFTRKAREEMERRLLKLGVKGVNVHTFNSFCEGILRKHGNLIYGRPIRIQDYSDKILAMNMALGNLGIDMEDAIQRYFTPKQRKFKKGNQLASSFMNDCFSVLEYFKVTGEETRDFSKDVEDKNKYNASMVYNITQYLREHMELQGLRDYSDQLIDAISFLKSSQEYIPRFNHILVDEYQDVNAMQIELLSLLSSPNLFAVGDPRQSIFGWRGSDINYILNFERTHGNVQTIHLTKNYRSNKKIVELMNSSIRDMGLPDLENNINIDGTKVSILDFETEEAERLFIVEKILSSNIPPEEIFILARTNRQLFELSQILKRRGIRHTVKTDDFKDSGEDRREMVLATIHAIKGLEARKVFVMGCNEQNFPCKASDHPAVEMIKRDNYDKLEEEKRLFYVAISRAKEQLYLTYSGKKPSHFITKEMLRISKESSSRKISVEDIFNKKSKEDDGVGRNYLEGGGSDINEMVVRRVEEEY